MTERGLPSAKAADTVRTAMRHRVEHRLELLAIDRAAVEIEYGDDTAHVVFNSEFLVREIAARLAA
jgi:hypothetical protein